MERDQALKFMHDLLRLMTQKNGSDLFITANFPPAIMVDGRYGLHFAGWKKHIGLYPVPVFDDDLEAEVKPLRRSKDSVALLHSDPLPEQLISRIAHAVVERRAS